MKKAGEGLKRSYFRIVLKSMKLKITSNKWFNSEPLSERDLSGRVVLVNFWTFACVNCARSFPRLRELWNKYKDRKFLMIGIHTPEFEFEKKPECVRRKLIDNNIYWPIALDNEYRNWKRFKNKYWPTIYLINKNGDVVYCHVGEGGYAKIEKLIQDLINAKKKKKVKSPEMIVEKTNNICFSATPDIHFGYRKGIPANISGYIADKDALYKRPRMIPQDKMALEGEFFSAPGYIQTQKVGSSIYLNFNATEIDLVMEPFGKEATAEVMLEGKPLPKEIRGRDVNDLGNAAIAEYKAYNILKADFPVSGVLKIRLREGKFKAYDLAFSGCVGRCDVQSDPS